MLLVLAASMSICVRALGQASLFSFAISRLTKVSLAITLTRRSVPRCFTCKVTGCKRSRLSMTLIFCNVGLMDAMRLADAVAQDSPLQRAVSWARNMSRAGARSGSDVWH